jgi:glycosyltransferase involved in cell wall biosynthesis
MNFSFSIIIPVYNRPQEIDELLNSILFQNYKKDIEIVVVEDGSTDKCEEIVNFYQEKLNIKYLFKKNSGPGQSRNFGMENASGNYFIILDSDVMLPKDYLSIVDFALRKNYTELFAAPDKSHHSFTETQKAINYTMTSFLTTGGLRNNKGKSKFQLRSFNMGMSKKTFELTKGFAKQNYGEDIDLSLRVDKLNLSKQFITKAFVYHKRRTNWFQFYKQINNFGTARPILNKTHKNTAKLTYWFPTLFTLGLFISIIGLVFGYPLLYIFYTLYFLLIFIHSLFQNRNIKVALFAVQAAFIQFLGYGMGFIKSQFKLNILQKSKEETFPKMFS